MDNYEHHKEVINTNKATIQRNEQLIDQTTESQNELPINVWDDLAAETQQEYDCDEGPQDDPEHALFYPDEIPDQGQAVLTNPTGKQQCSLAINTVPTSLAFADYSKHTSISTKNNTIPSPSSYLKLVFIVQAD